jgi:PAS domain S-box-containing protein
MRGGEIVVMRGATRRELAEEIRQRKDFYETLLKAQSDVGEGLLVVEAGRIRYANEAFCLISGYSTEELTTLPSVLDKVRRLWQGHERELHSS